MRNLTFSIAVASRWSFAKPFWLFDTWQFAFGPLRIGLRVPEVATEDIQEEVRPCAN